jgi:hypothetical protein
VKNNTIELVKVKIINYVDNYVIVQGIPNETQVLSDKFNGIHLGMKVEIISNTK